MHTFPSIAQLDYSESKFFYLFISAGENALLCSVISNSSKTSTKIIPPPFNLILWHKLFLSLWITFMMWFLVLLFIWMCNLFIQLDSSFPAAMGINKFPNECQWTQVRGPQNLDQEENEFKVYQVWHYPPAHPSSCENLIYSTVS